MVNCVMRRDDRRRVRPARCAQCGATRDRLARYNTPACYASDPDQAEALRSRQLLCNPCSRKAAVAATAPARGADIQRRRAATTGGDNREPKNCFTALFQSAEAQTARSRSRASSAHLLGMQRRVRTPTSATASTSVSGHEEEREIALFDNKPLPRTLRSPPVSSSTNNHNKQAIGSPFGLDLDQVDLRRPQTRPRRHTTSTLPTPTSSDKTGAQQDAREPTPAPKLSPRRRMARAKSQQYPTSSVRVDLSYLSEYK